MLNVVRYLWKSKCHAFQIIKIRRTIVMRWLEIVHILTFTEPTTWYTVLQKSNSWKEKQFLIGTFLSFEYGINLGVSTPCNYNTVSEQYISKPMEIKNRFHLKGPQSRENLLPQGIVNYFQVYQGCKWGLIKYGEIL